MNGHYTADEVDLANRVGHLCYGETAVIQMPLSVPQIHTALAELDPADVDAMLQRFAERRLIRLSIAGEQIHRTPRGKEAYEIDAIPELVFGMEYVANKYRAAVVHIIVSGPETGQESGGTGFFVAEPLNRIATAKHVVEGREIVRIENVDGVVLAGVGGIRLCAGQLDLALIECPTPAGVNPLRVEWREEATNELERVLILGYPPFAGHHVGLFQAAGQINAKLRPLGEERKYSVIISVGAPGCSGGPVISEVGHAAAVISQENTLNQINAPNTAFVSAVLSCHLSEIA